MAKKYVASEAIDRQRVTRWTDTRAAARATAKAKLDEMRAGAIEALAKKSRAEARERGAPRYIGKPCERHDNAERYTSDGKCVLCSQEHQAARHGRPQKAVKLRAVTIRNPIVSKFTGRAAPVIWLDDDT